MPRKKAVKKKVKLTQIYKGYSEIKIYKSSDIPGKLLFEFSIEDSKDMVEELRKERERLDNIDS